MHAGAILALTAAFGWGLGQAAQAEIGPAFLLALAPVLVALLLVPLLAYHFYALRGAAYTLERDRIQLRWGLRLEEIPMSEVVWVRSSRELGAALPLPWMRWPGAVLGVRRTSGGQAIEFLAARSNPLVVIATQQTLYAITPEDEQGFLNAYQHLSEMGSLNLLERRSVYPTFLVGRVWRARPARAMLAAGLLFNLALLAWVSLTVPERSQIVLGFIAGAEPVPSVRLLLLPFISGFFFLVDLFAGLFFFRRDDAAPGDGQSGEDGRAGRQALAYVLWTSGTITSLLFLLGVYFILKTG